MAFEFQPLTDGVVTLRLLQMDDLEDAYQAVRESLNDLQPWMNWAHPGYSIDETRLYLQRVTDLRAGDDYAFAITDAGDGSFIGGCGLNNFNPAYRFCNLGYWVRHSRRGHRYAARAARLAARFGLENLGLIRIEIVVAVDNLASLRVAEKAGATREGILRNRMIINHQPADAVMHSLIVEDL